MALKAKDIVTPSDFPGFQKRLNEAFKLAEREEKEARHLDIKVFLDFLEKKSLFRKSLKENICLLYDLMHLAAERVNALKENPLDEKSEDVLAHTLLPQIDQVKGQIIEELEEGRQILLEHSQRLRNIAKGDRAIVAGVQEFFRDLNRKKKPGISDAEVEEFIKKKQGFITQFSTDTMTPLFNLVNFIESLRAAYERDTKFLNSIIENEVGKIEAHLKTRNKDQLTVNFQPILAHLQESEAQLIRLIRDVESRRATETALLRQGKQLEKALEHMLHGELQ